METPVLGGNVEAAPPARRNRRAFNHVPAKKQGGLLSEAVERGVFGRVSPPEDTGVLSAAPEDE